MSENKMMRRAIEIMVGAILCENADYAYRAAVIAARFARDEDASLRGDDEQYFAQPPDGPLAQCYSCGRYAESVEDAVSFVPVTVDESDPESGPSASDIVDVEYCPRCARNA